MNGLITMASSSTSSLYGNIGCSIRELILSKFPYKYFKYTNVSSEVAFKNMRRQFGRNTNTEIRKRRMPYLNIQPVYQPMDENDFLQGIHLTDTTDDMHYGINANTLFLVLKDRENGYNLRFKINRDRIEYDVRIVMSTIHQQIDQYKNMKNHMTWNKTLSHTMALESVIPKSIIRYMSKLCRLDIEKDPNMIPIFLQRMNRLSAYPITYKLRNASATDEYFMYYNHNVYITFTDLDKDTGNKRNMVDDTFEISFKVTAEFNLPGMYIIDAQPDFIGDIKVQLASASKLPIEDDPNVDYIPLYTMSNFYNRYPMEKDGMTLYTSSIFTVKKRKKNVLVEKVAINTLFDYNHQKVLKYYSGMNMKTSTICKIIITKDKEELNEGTDYKVDWSRFAVLLKNPEYKSTYRIIIYIDNIKYTDMVRDMTDEQITEKYKLKDNTIDYAIFSKNELTDWIGDRAIYKDDTGYYFEDEGERVDIGNMYEEGADLTSVPYPTQVILERTDVVLDPEYSALDMDEIWERILSNAATEEGKL